MSAEDFETRLYGYLDGELSPPEAAAFEAEMAASPVLEQRVTYERELGDLVRRACRETASDAVKGRLLGALRDDARRGKPVAEPRGHRFSLFDWRVFTLPVAAAFAGAMLWFGGAFSALVDAKPSHHPHPPLVDLVVMNDVNFQHRVGFDVDPSERERSMAEALANEPDHLMWLHSDDRPAKARFEECAQLMRALGWTTPLPTLPRGVEPRAFRVAQIKIGSGSVNISRVPNILLERGKERLSVYLVMGSEAGELRAKLESDSAVKLDECPDCGILFRTWGDSIVIFISSMPFRDLRQIAQDI